MREAGTIIIIIVSLATAIGLTSVYFLKDDNPVEESCEQVIKIATGNDIDLTENSPEKKPDEKK